MTDAQIDSILAVMKSEVFTASRTFHAFHSMHEGYAVIAEELDELWDGVKRNDAELVKTQGTLWQKEETA